MTFYVTMYSFFLSTGAAMGADLFRIRRRRRSEELRLAPVVPIGLGSPAGRSAS